MHSEFYCKTIYRQKLASVFIAWEDLIHRATLDNEIHRSSLGGALTKSHKEKKIK